MKTIGIPSLLAATLATIALSCCLIGCSGASQTSQGTTTAGASDDTSSSAVEQQPAPVSESLDTTDWKSYSIRVAGRVFTLPFMLSDLDSTGLSTKIYAPGYQQSDGRYQTAARTYSSSPDTAYLGTNFFADSEDPQANEIEIGHVTAQKKADAQADFEVVIPGGITWGASSIEDAISVFGEPDEVADSTEILKADCGITKFYSWRDESQVKPNGRLEIGVDDAGVIVHIYLAAPGQRN